MHEDLTNFSLSGQATKTANLMKEKEIFPDALSAAKFGMAYAIKYYWEDVGTIEKIKNIGEYDSKGNRYNVGSVESDIPQIIEALYPNCESPYKIMRTLMCFGLNKLGELEEDNRLFPINENM